MEVFIDAGQQHARTIGGIFKAVLAEHYAKLNLLADTAGAKPSVNYSTLSEQKRAQGLAFIIPAGQAADTQPGA